MWWAIIAASGVILAAVYLLWMVQKVLFGPLQNPANENLKDLSFREVCVLTPLMAMALLLGLKPGIVLERIEPSVQRFVVEVHQRAQVPPYRADTGALKQRALAPIQQFRPRQQQKTILRPVPNPRFRPTRLLDAKGKPIRRGKNR